MDEKKCHFVGCQTNNWMNEWTWLWMCLCVTLDFGHSFTFIGFRVSFQTCTNWHLLGNCCRPQRPQIQSISQSSLKSCTSIFLVRFNSTICLSFSFFGEKMLLVPSETTEITKMSRTVVHTVCGAKKNIWENVYVSMAFSNDDRPILLISDDNERFEFPFWCKQTSHRTLK